MTTFVGMILVFSDIKILVGMTQEFNMEENIKIILEKYVIIVIELNYEVSLIVQKKCYNIL